MAPNPPTPSAERRADLLARVTLVAPGLILFREQERASIPALELMFGRVEELAAGAPFRLIVDVSASNRPGPAESAWIQAWYKSNADGDMERFALVTGSNRLINAALKFIARSAGFQAFETFGTVEAATLALSADRAS